MAGERSGPVAASMAVSVRPRGLSGERPAGLGSAVRALARSLRVSAFAEVEKRPEHFHPFETARGAGRAARIWGGVGHCRRCRATEEQALPKGADGWPPGPVGASAGRSETPSVSVLARRPLSLPG